MLGAVANSEGLVLSAICLALGTLILGMAAHRPWWERTPAAQYENWTRLGVVLNPKPRTRPLAKGWRLSFVVLGAVVMAIAALGIYASVAG
jgi:hypothetical protein